MKRKLLDLRIGKYLKYAIPMLVLLAVLLPAGLQAEWGDKYGHRRTAYAREGRGDSSYRKYRVKKGDTLYRISRKFKISVNSITAANNLRKNGYIRRGMILKLPVSGKKKRTAAKRGTNRKKEPPAKKVRFRWPVRYILHCKRDGLKGVKPIGVIITSKPGSPVISSARGKVKKIGRMRGYGKYVIITHKNRYITVYSNLDRIVVSEGDSVGSGRTIGRINRANKKLHFQIDHSGKPKNPLHYLPKRS
ncbi:MAG: LysM peptidoglycan-binding domain-containing M23 family metallopeptidase [bacterium]|nr:LysM peptidoglycan-binding domain-containing M23 family metallopeptidase [bacterium]